MKKSMNLILLIGIFLVHLSCSSFNSQKGHWDLEEKKMAKDKLTRVLKQKFTEKGQSIDDNVINDIVDCWINKLEAEFTNLNAVDRNPIRESELSESCIKEILMPIQLPAKF